MLDHAILLLLMMLLYIGDLSLILPLIMSITFRECKPSMSLCSVA